MEIVLYDHADTIYSYFAGCVQGYTSLYSAATYSHYFYPAEMVVVEPSKVQHQRRSWLFQGDRVGTETEVRHYKAEWTPVVSPADPDKVCYRTFTCDDVAHPYSPWIRSVSIAGSVSPNSLEMTITEYLVTGKAHTAYLKVKAVPSESGRGTFTWSAGYPLSYASDERGFQSGQVPLMCRSMAADIVGSAPPLDWIRSEMGAKVNRTDLKGAEQEAWGQCLSNLCMNTNNLANIVSIANGAAELGAAAKAGASLFKSIASRTGGDIAPQIWQDLERGIPWKEARKLYAQDTVRKGVSVSKSTWLRWRFEYKTSKSDFDEALDFFERTGINVELVKADGDPTKIWKALFGENIAEHSTQHGCADAGPCTVRVTVQFQPHFSKPVYSASNAIANISGRIQWNLKKYGLQPNYYNLWDMVPLSFLGDYVYNVGQATETLSRNDIGDYFGVKRACVSRKTVIESTWDGAPVILTSYERQVPTEIPRFEAQFPISEAGSSDTSTKTKVMRIVDGVSMLGG